MIPHISGIAAPPTSHRWYGNQYRILDTGLWVDCQGATNYQVFTPSNNAFSSLATLRHVKYSIWPLLIRRLI
jgi:hypothetical protein